jgi:hypothetical protein
MNGFWGMSNELACLGYGLRFLPSLDHPLARLTRILVTFSRNLLARFYFIKIQRYLLSLGCQTEWSKPTWSVDVFRDSPIVLMIVTTDGNKRMPGRVFRCPKPQKGIKKYWLRVSAWLLDELSPMRAIRAADLRRVALGMDLNTK